MKDYRLVFRRDNGPLLHKIDYSENDRSFFTNPWPIEDSGLLYGYIEIGFDSRTMCVAGVSGFSPKQSWRSAVLSIPDRISIGKLIVIGDLEPGNVYRADTEENSWKAYYDERRNWVYLGNKDVKGDLVHVRFLKNAVATLQKERIKACWIDLNEVQFSE